MTYVWKSHLSSSLIDEHIRIVEILVTKAEIILVASWTVFFQTYWIGVWYGHLCLVYVHQSRIRYGFKQILVLYKVVKNSSLILIEFLLLSLLLVMLLLMHAEVHDLVWATNALCICLSKRFATSHHVGINLKLFWIRSVYIPWSGVIEIIVRFLYHFIVHHLIIGRICIHLNFIGLRTLIAATSNTRLLSPFEKSLLIRIMRLSALIYLHSSEASWISFI